VIVGVGRVTGIEPHVEYEHRTDAEPSSVVWERNVKHSIRPAVGDGFMLPYQEAQEAAIKDEEIDLASMVAYTPDEHWDAFSYGSEHVTSDGAIAALLSVILACC